MLIYTGTGTMFSANQLQQAQACSLEKMFIVGSNATIFDIGGVATEDTFFFMTDSGIFGCAEVGTVEGVGFKGTTPFGIFYADQGITFGNNPEIFFTTTVMEAWGNQVGTRFVNLPAVGTYGAIQMNTSKIDTQSNEYAFYIDPAVSADKGIVLSGNMFIGERNVFAPGSIDQTDRRVKSSGNLGLSKQSSRWVFYRTWKILLIPRPRHRVMTG